MIKKLIGVVAAAGILAVLFFTVLHRDKYRSVWFEEGTSLLDVFGKSEPVEAPLAEPSSAAAPDEMPVSDAPASDSATFDRSADSVAWTGPVDSADPIDPIAPVDSIDSADSAGAADRPEAAQAADSVR